MLTSKIFSACPAGIEARLVTVETCLRRKGMPGFSLVGLPDTAVREAKERVMAAVRNSGLQFPSAKITVSLAPADLKKEGSEFDLPMALGVLVQDGRIPEDKAAEICSRYLFAGELGLDGELRPVRGVLAMACAAKEKGFSGIVIPTANKEEAALVEGLEVLPCENLAQVLNWFFGQEALAPYHRSVLPEVLPPPLVDFADIEGQALAKKALETAAAGGHNVLMVGPPGAGKTLLARALPGLLPPLSPEETLSVTKIYSAAGLLGDGAVLMLQRPFRAVHHTASAIALAGGGVRGLPGEISLAHHGVLFLDEMAEFPRAALETLRQPMEDGEISVSRAAGRFRYPARFILAAAANPCPCGWWGFPERDCVCSPAQILRYRQKLSGPLMDRMDIQVEVTAKDFRSRVLESNGEGRAREPGESSPEAARRVRLAREIQRNRYGSPEKLNAHMNLAELKSYCKMEKSAQQFLGGAMKKLSLSARAYHRILKVARTLADLEGGAPVSTGHLSVALNLRAMDRMRTVDS